MDRQTDRQTNTETARRTNKQTKRPIDRQGQKQRPRQRDTQTKTDINIQTDRQTYLRTLFLSDLAEIPDVEPPIGAGRSQDGFVVRRPLNLEDLDQSKGQLEGLREFTNQRAS